MSDLRRSVNDSGFRPEILLLAAVFSVNPNRMWFTGLILRQSTQLSALPVLSKLDEDFCNKLLKGSRNDGLRAFSLGDGRSTLDRQLQQEFEHDFQVLSQTNQWEENGGD